MKAKNIFILALSLAFLFSINLVEGQSLKKTIKRESKRLTRLGYYVSPGALPIKQQLTKSYSLEAEYDSIGFPKYFIASGIAVAQNHSVAQAHALAVAKIVLANMVKSNIAGIVETDLSNKQLTTEEAKSISKVVSAYTDLIAQEMGRVVPVVILFREKGDNIEANVRLAYNIPMAMKAAKDVLMNRLEKETDIAREKLEKLMNIDRLTRGN